MTSCAKIRIKRRSICIGDLKYLIELNNRAIQAPELGSVDYDETFTPTETVRAAIETKSGETIFDQSNTEHSVTHRFYIRFLSGVTAETWIKFDSDLYDILTVENLDGQNRFLLLRCTIRGLSTVKTNLA